MKTLALILVSLNPRRKLSRTRASLATVAFVVFTRRSSPRSFAKRLAKLKTFNRSARKRGEGGSRKPTVTHLGTSEGWSEEVARQSGVGIHVHGRGMGKEYQTTTRVRINSRYSVFSTRLYNRETISPKRISKLSFAPVILP